MFIIALLLMFSDRLNIRILHKLIEISKIMKDISVRPARAPELKKKKIFLFFFILNEVKGFSWQITKWANKPCSLKLYHLISTFINKQINNRKLIKKHTTQWLSKNIHIVQNLLTMFLCNTHNLQLLELDLTKLKRQTIYKLSKPS